MWIDTAGVLGECHNSNMRSNAVTDRDGAMAVLERYRMAVSDLAKLPMDVLGIPDLFTVLDTVQTARCQVPGVEHRAINEIAARATPEEIGRSLKKVLADRLRITPGKRDAGSPTPKCWGREQR